MAKASIVEIVNNEVAGTGWMYRVDRNGKAWILTNEHVVRGARTVSVRQTGGFGVRVGTVVGLDDIRDLAVVTICCNLSWQALRTDSTTTLRPGSAVVALGFPDERVGTDLSVTAGVVSSYGFHDESRSWIIQTDAVLNPGKSGGPLLNAEGQVIGLVSARVDLALGENIGFAISMRTLEQELDFLEVGATVMVDPTPSPTQTPTRTPTRVPTTVPSTAGVSGELVHNPRSGSIGCSNDRYPNTVISYHAMDSAAYVEFEVPGVVQWSIGFLYHDPDTGGTTDSATFIYTNPDGDLFANHWVRVNDEDIGKDELEYIPRNELLRGTGRINELSFRTTSNGSYLRLNDFVFEVPNSKLSRKFGKSQLCVGFWSDEEDPYAISYSNLRTQFELEGSSAELTHDGIDDGQINCPEGVYSDSVISERAIDLWAIFDFVAPDITVEWSIGVLYHNVGEFESATLVYSNSPYHLGTRHWSHLDGNWEYPDEKYVRIDRRLLGNAGSVNVFEIETSVKGTWLRLNGEKVLSVATADLVRRSGHAQICVGFHNDELEPYEIAISNLWAWAE